MKKNLWNYGFLLLLFTALVSVCYAQDQPDYKAQIEKINVLLIKAEREGWEKGYKALAFTLTSVDINVCDKWVYINAWAKEK
ncbi:MAG: hypothetical protein ABIJ04_02465 [Bacteroidota bacterium]